MIEIRPQPGPQEQFLSSPADIVFYGGSAGGGKSWGLMLEALRHKNVPHFVATIFRRTSVQIDNPGGLWDESMTLFSQVKGAVPREYIHEWEFPSGAVLQMRHLEHEKSRLNYQGSAIALLGFDELTHFTRTQFFYMLSRNRSTCGVRPYVRATMNPVPPDDPVGGWVHEFVGWYLDADGYADPKKCGVVRWFVTVKDKPVWGDSRQELKRLHPKSRPKSFTFILSSIYDNQVLMEKDPGYLANLMALDLVDRERLLGKGRRGGNWLIKPEAGKVFNRAWFEIVDAAPAGGREVRFWDLAATEKKMEKDDPDFTASCKMKIVDGVVYILDAIAEQLDPARTDALIVNTASQDGRRVAVRFELEGGASGKRDAQHIVQKLPGYDVRGVRPLGDKVVRAKGLAAQAYAGNVKLVRGAWNDRFLSVLHSFPDGAHDDEVDAASGAYNELTGGPNRRQHGSQQG